MTPALTYCPADLHVHTVLSPCAELEMIPPLIVQQASRLGLQLLAVTDHNSAENAGALIEAGRRAGIAVIPGMEVQTREEVHLICLFDSLEHVLAWQERVYACLPALKNREDVFGSQVVVDAEGDFVALNERLLLTSIDLSVEQVFAEVISLGGLVIPAHIDRPSFSLIANLGLLPAGLDMPALEVSARARLSEVRDRFPFLQNKTLIRSGDAHRLSELINLTLFKVAHLSLAEMQLAVRGEQGRKVVVE